MSGMETINTLLTNHLDLWTSAIARKSSAGRGRSKKFSLYGIDKLRALILDLAVRGKLVPQDPADESAPDLLQRITAERALLVKARKIRDKASLPDVANDQAPFGIPTTWRWVKLANIADFSAGRTPPRNEPSYWNNGDNAWVSIADIDDGQVLTSTKETVSNEAKERIYALEPEAAGTILMSFKLTIGKICRLGIPAFHNEAIVAVRPFVPDLDRFLFKVLPRFARQGDTKSAIMGATLNRESISGILLPLPPLAEQYRIVDKVDELMALCDRLEAGTCEAIEAHQLLVKELLATLSASRDASELAENWARIETHFDALFVTEDSIDQLKQTILQLAVMGRLSHQMKGDDKSNQHDLRPDDQAESFDLKSFHARARLFPLPDGWLILPLSRVCTNIVDCPHTTPQWTEEGCICVKSDQVKPGFLDLASPNYVSEETFIERIERLEPQENDILFKREGGILGVAARIPPNTKLCLGQRLMLVRATKAVLPEFLELVLNSKWITDFALEKTTGGAAPRVNMAIVRAFPIPVPPLSEQVRIIAKVGELMALCDAYSSLAREAADQQIQIANVVVTRAVA